MTTPSVAITGAHGFLGWHLACRLRAVHGVEPVRLGREDLADPERLREVVGSVDTIYHVAGVNRAGSDEEVRQGNLDLACTLAEAIRASGRPVHVVYANSIQSDDDNAYGRGKRTPRRCSRRPRARWAARWPTCCSRTCSGSTAGRRTTPSWRPSRTRWQTAGSPR